MAMSAKAPDPSGEEARLDRLLDLLDRSESERDAASTSVRLPVALREAAALAAEMGLTGSASELTVTGLRRSLEALAQRAVLDAHYERVPRARPSLVELAQAAAELDGSALAARPDLLARAAAAVVALRPGADADDVLLYAAGLAAAVA
ncbi:MAG: hypothetical protein AB7W59_02970 [Acidimicrobiia bacterium]